MKITVLVENTSSCELTPLHGLSLFVETARHKLLFDLGPDGETLFANAEKMNLDLTAVDTVILSHGHADHGGALEFFLERNHIAAVYLQKSALAPHFRILPGELPVFNGIDESIARHPQVRLLEEDRVLDEELSLFTVPATAQKYRSEANDVLYEKDKRDLFLHEQNLLIRENSTALIMGCGHTGVINILEKAAAAKPKICIGGFHLMNPTTGQPVSAKFLAELANVLQDYGKIDFYTCHCTGAAALTYLSGKLSNMHAISCGDILVW